MTTSPTDPDNETTARKITRLAGGSKTDQFNDRLLNGVLRSTWVVSDGGDRAAAEKEAMIATMAAMVAFNPKDEVEGMIVGQACALHAAAMECFRRAMLPDQPSEAASRLRKDGANAARAMVDMLAALDRKRGKGPQVVRVERVIVHEGGQAVVGNVTTGSMPAPSPAPSSIEHGSAPMDLMTEAEKEGVQG